MSCTPEAAAAVQERKEERKEVLLVLLVVEESLRTHLWTLLPKEGRGAALQRETVSVRDSEPRSALAVDLRGREGGGGGGGGGGSSSAAPRPSLLIWTAGITT